jgi:predicted SAM-dependent methyltransferase
MKRLPVKYDSAGRALLNLACGTRTDASWNNLDFSPYASLRRRPHIVKALREIGFLSAERYQRLQAIDPAIIRWNLARGIPFADSTFDVVYHSHFLEHLEREAAVKLLGECYRVLKPGGILRIVVPDLETLALLYRDALEALDKSGDTSENEAAHNNAIAELFDQMVRIGSSGTAEQKPWVRAIERLIRGSASDTGENHRWMYDRQSLSRILARLGFTTIRQHYATTSGIAGWERCFLDYNPDGSVYKTKSLYVEASKDAMVEPHKAHEATTTWDYRDRHDLEHAESLRSSE